MMQTATEMITTAKDGHVVVNPFEQLFLHFNRTSPNINPAQDVNADNMVAILIFNCFVCLILVVLYELLRRCIPSVYSQAILTTSHTAATTTTGATTTITTRMLGFFWCISVFQTPWSTFRTVAGLDAYFYLRYIRMCLKISAVSSFWAIIILCPVYATGGGGQTDFYYFSMANVKQEDKARMWVPFTFCWAFTMYCWFCIRAEMIHYVDLRMEFLGGEDEELILIRMRQSKGGLISIDELRDYMNTSGRAIVDGYEEDVPQDDNRFQDERSELLITTCDEGGEELAVGGCINTPLLSSAHDYEKNIVQTTTATTVQQQMKQHRYSLQVEKIPVALRSNTALFNYFNEIFPGQVHSASIAMNVPDLDTLSARRMRACRGLEKSLAYYNATGIRPTHIVGRPRFQCCGIESAPMCSISCCCYSGDQVDSIQYYTYRLANFNIEMQKLQSEKFLLAQTGAMPPQSGDVVADVANCGSPLDILRSSTAIVAEGLRSEFEACEEEGHVGNGVGAIRHGTTKRHSATAPQSLANVDDATSSLSTSSQGKNRFSSRTYSWFRDLLWRLGFDFLASFFEEVRNRTDVVVDSVTLPSMSSTGFVTFKCLTPVTVSTSAPLTYNRNPMKLFVAPEPRDIVWKNIQIDHYISTGRAFVANVLLGLGVFLWSIPLTLIQAWAKVENVAMIPGLEWVGEIHGGTWDALINGYLPVITLLGLILLLPIIFEWVATSYEKRKTLSGVEDSIVGRYFYYQLANIYITVTAGAIWTSLADIIDHPQSLLETLGKTLPRLAGYFISLLITKTLAGLPLILLRFGALTRMTFLRSCFSKKRLTQRELNELYRKESIYYGWVYPTQFLVIIICFTYACISPLVLPMGSIYFFFALLVYKKQALYVYSPTYESGGKMFPQAISKTLFALVISQLTFIGYTLIRKGTIGQIILLAPLPFLTAYFTYYIDNRYVRPSKKLSLERAVKIDNLLESPDEFSRKTYQQPVLTESASVVPMCDAIDGIISEVMENLERLQNEAVPQDRPLGVHSLLTINE